MILQLSEQAGNAVLNSLGALLNGGTIEVLTNDGKLIAALRLSNPATQPAVESELVFARIGEDVAAVGGKAATARLVSSSGQEIAVVDVGDENSDAVIRLNTITIARGSPVQLGSFKLAMP